MNLVVATVFFNDGRKTTSFDVNDDNKIIIIHILWKSRLYIMKLFYAFQPSNIFFAMDGSIKIGDFGLVTAIEENCCDNCYTSIQTPLLHDGRHTDKVGTKLYMSPEQVCTADLLVFVTC